MKSSREESKQSIYWGGGRDLKMVQVASGGSQGPKYSPDNWMAESIYLRREMP